MLLLHFVEEFSMEEIREAFGEASHDRGAADEEGGEGPTRFVGAGG